MPRVAASAATAAGGRAGGGAAGAAVRRGGEPSRVPRQQRQAALAALHGARDGVSGEAEAREVERLDGDGGAGDGADAGAAQDGDARLAARAATAPASASQLAPATANAPTSAPLNTVVAGAASRFTIFETLSCIVRWVVRASDRCIAASDSADGWRSICVSDASVSSRSRLASSRGVRRGSPATREHSHIEHHASARSSTCAHVSQLHVGASTAGDAVAVAAEAKRTGIFFRAKFWPAQQRAMLPFPNRRGRASRGVGEVGASLSSPREVNAHVSSRSTCSAVP